MNLRIIAGSFGGRTIQAPSGFKTHPMGDRIRTALFNIVNARLDDAEVLDAFAGSGALGLESISRGAKSAVFIERDRSASQIIKRNIELLDVSDKSDVVQIGLSTWIDKNSDARFDIIFADPPYNDLQLGVIQRLGELLKPNGLLVLSYPDKTETPVLTGLSQTDDRNYGTASLGFYEKF